MGKDVPQLNIYHRQKSELKKYFRYNDTELIKLSKDVNPSFV